MTNKIVFYKFLPRRQYKRTWVNSVPKEYWRNFLQLLMEGINSFYPPPNTSERFAYWRIIKDTLELAYEPTEESAYLHYARGILAKNLDEIVTKSDWNKRMSQILKEKH